jgi:hypothetical protein
MGPPLVPGAGRDLTDGLPEAAPSPTARSGAISSPGRLMSMTTNFNLSSSREAHASSAHSPRAPPSCLRRWRRSAPACIWRPAGKPHPPTSYVGDWVTRSFWWRGEPAFRRPQGVTLPIGLADGPIRSCTSIPQDGLGRPPLFLTV